MATSFFTFSSWARKALRSGVPDLGSKLRKMSAPGESTLGHKAPAYLIPALVDYTKLSKDLVLEIEKIEDKQKSLVLANKRPIKDFPLIRFEPSWPSPPILKTEGDVVRAANLELISWVTTALEQVTGLSILPTSESSQPDDTRPDMVWFYVVAGKEIQDEKNWKLFAVMEFKNTNMIDVNGFQPAIFQNRSMTEDQFYDTALKVPDDTLIEGKRSKWLTQQMTKYARSSGVPHQVAFDWSTMLTLDFEWDMGKNPESQPNAAQIAWLNGECKDGTGFNTHRSFLLGYLFHALRDTMKREGINL